VALILVYLVRVRVDTTVSIPRSGSVALIQGICNPRRRKRRVSIPRSGSVALIQQSRRHPQLGFTSFNPPFGIGGPHTVDASAFRVHMEVSIPRSGSVALIPVDVQIQLGECEVSIPRSGSVALIRRRPERLARH